MKMQLKKLLAVMCLTVTGSVIAATPPSTPLVTPNGNLQPVVLAPTLTGVTAPAEIFAGDEFTVHIQGTGLCKYVLDAGVYTHTEPPASTQTLPNWIAAKPSVSWFPFLTKTNESFHIYTLKVTATGTCKSPGGQPVTTTMKVKRPVLDNPGNSPVVVPFTASCPAPYLYHTDNSDGGKGEFYCKKYEPTCPAGWTGSVDKATGTLTCNSTPQPNIACPKSTPTWASGASYYKESWDKMGCKANVPANLIPK